MKKSIVFILIGLFFLPVTGLANTSSYVNVEISDNYVGYSPEYSISFYPETDLIESTEITIVFDDKIPIRRLDNTKDKIAINGFYLTEDPQFLGHSIKLFLPFELEKKKEITIVIEKGIILNPQDPGYFKLHIEYNNENLESNCYRITNQSKVKKPELKLLDNEIKINFSVGQNGNLDRYTTTSFGKGPFTFVQPVPRDFIFIRFSPILSDSFTVIPRNNIKINGTNPPLSPEVKMHFEDTAIEEKEIAIIVPRDINARDDIKIVINGITLPEKQSGDAYVMVWTSKEMQPVKSNTISMKGDYFINTSSITTPSAPDGKNEFYVSKVILDFSVDTGSSIDEYDTYYSKDNENFILYEKPIELNDRIQNIYFYSVGLSDRRTFKEDVKKIKFNIDTMPPIILLESQTESESPIYELKIKIEDDNFDYAAVTVHNIKFVFKSKTFDLPLYLYNEETTFLIEAIDKAGNSSELSDIIKQS